MLIKKRSGQHASMAIVLSLKDRVAKLHIINNCIYLYINILS